MVRFFFDNGHLCVESHSTLSGISRQQYIWRHITYKGVEGVVDLCIRTWHAYWDLLSECIINCGISRLSSGMEHIRWVLMNTCQGIKGDVLGAERAWSTGMSRDFPGVRACGWLVLIKTHQGIRGHSLLVTCHGISQLIVYRVLPGDQRGLVNWCVFRLAWG